MTSIASTGSSSSFAIPRVCTVTRAGWALLDDRLKRQGVDLGNAAHRLAMVRSLRLPEGVLSDIACGLSPAVSEFFLKPLADFAKMPLQAIAETRAQELLTFGGTAGTAEIRLWMPACDVAPVLSQAASGGGLHIKIGTGPGRVRAAGSYGAQLLCQRHDGERIVPGARYLLESRGEHLVGLAFGGEAFALEDHLSPSGEASYGGVVGAAEVRVLARVVAELALGRSWRPEQFAAELADVVVPEEGWALLCEHLSAEGMDPALPSGRYKLSEEFGVPVSTFYALWESRGSVAPHVLLGELCERVSLDLADVLKDEACAYLPFRHATGGGALGLIVSAAWSDLPVALRADCLFVTGADLLPHRPAGTVFFATGAVTLTCGCSYLVERRGHGLLVARAIGPEQLGAADVWRFVCEGTADEFSVPVGSLGDHAPGRLVIYAPDAPYAILGRIVGELRILT